MKNNIIIERLRITETYYSKKHKLNLPCGNNNSYCYWQYAISGAGKIHYCFCELSKNPGIHAKQTVDLATISD